MNGGMQLLVFCGIFLGMFFLTMVLSFVIPMLMLDGANPMDIDLKDPDGLRVSKILQLVSQFTFFCLPALIFAWLAHKSPRTYLRWKSPVKKKHWLYGIAIIVAAIPFISSLEYLNKLIPLPEIFAAMEKLAAETTEAFLSGTTPIEIVSNILIFVVFAAVFEELLFRGVLQNILVDNWFVDKAWLGILIAAFLFSAMHGQMAGFFPRFFAGIILGLAYHYSGSLWVPILMHAINNGLSIYLFYLEKEGRFQDDVFYEQPQVWMGFGFGLICLAFIYLMSKEKVAYSVVSADHDPSNTNIFTQR